MPDNPSTEIIIRPFQPGDAEDFRRLNEAWITTHFRLEDKDREVLGDPAGAILAPGGHIVMAEVGGRAVGCVALLPLPDGGYEVAKMAVAPDRRGQGVGRRLLDAAIAWEGRRGPGVCTWKATPGSRPRCACTSPPASGT